MAPGHLKRSAGALAARRPATTTTTTQAPIATTPTPSPAAPPAAQPTVQRPQRRPATRAKRRPARHGTRARTPRTTGVASPVAAPVAAVTAPTPVAGPAAPAPRKQAPAAQHATKGAAQQPLQQAARTVTRTVRNVVHVLPYWAKLLIGALGVLAWLAVVLAAAAALRNRRLRRQRERLLGDVAALEQALLPAIPERFGDLAVSVAYRPADGSRAGGDFYDVFALDHGCVGVIVGDVVGHGPGSLAPATFIRHMVRSYLEAGLPPHAAIQLAGNVLDDQGREEFATVVAGIYDPVAGTLAYATAGHQAPIVSGPGRHVPITVGSSPPAGAGATTGLRQTTVALPPGSTACFFTDGLSYARTSAGVYGRDRLEREVEELGLEASAQELVDHVARSVGRLSDDVVVCLLRPEGEATAASAVRVEEIQVTYSDLYSPRLRRFLDACGVERADADAALAAAAPHVVGYGSVLLRVRQAEDRSGVDVVPVEAPPVGAEVADVHPLN